jgi:hypothetical protein
MYTPPFMDILPADTRPGKSPNSYSLHFLIDWHHHHGRSHTLVYSRKPFCASYTTLITLIMDPSFEPEHLFPYSKHTNVCPVMSSDHVPLFLWFYFFETRIVFCILSSRWALVFLWDNDNTN